MKKIALILLALFVFSAVVAVADDASVMPARVGRLYIASTYAFANGTYDQDNKYQSYDNGEGKLSLFNLGFALEYGINDWITAAVQWAPGINLYSDVDSDISTFNHPLAGPLPTGNDSKLNINDMSDIFVGAKFLIVGDKAPIPNDMVRFSLATGVLIPTPGPDADDQLKNLNNKDDVTAAAADKHALAFGGRAYFDYIINKSFFINLYSQYMYFMEKKVDELAIGAPALGNPNAIVENTYNYGYKLTLEAEGHFDTMLNPGMKFSAGLPVTYVTSPDYEMNDVKISDSASSTLSLGPNVSLFLLKSVLPVEFKLGYSVPVWGTNSTAVNALTLQVKAYFKL